MANDVGGHLIRIDTFGADVVVSTSFIRVNAMLITGYTSGKTVTLIDNNGDNALVVEVPSGGTAQITPARPMRFPRGITFDDSESDLAAGDFIFMWIER